MTEYDCATCGETVDIVTMLDHDCDAILSVENLDKRERQALTFVESQVVDNGGMLDFRRMNHDDHDAMRLFQARGLLEAEETDAGVQVTAFFRRGWELAWECRFRLARERGNVEVEPNG